MILGYSRDSRSVCNVMVGDGGSCNVLRNSLVGDGGSSDVSGVAVASIASVRTTVASVGSSMASVGTQTIISVSGAEDGSGTSKADKAGEGGELE